LSTAEARALLEELNELGVAVHAAPDGSLRCRPKKAIGEARAERIRRHKAELREILSQPEDKENLSSPSVLSSPTPTKTDTYEDSGGTIKGTMPKKLSSPRSRRPGRSASAARPTSSD